ncbi:MAG: arsenic resistance protein [Candidatus Diapherotrites archaeon]|nr:arsenic resistance protein [Candidatus Diapherotrites archaeon]
MRKILAIQKNLSNNILLYTILMIVFGMLVGYYIPSAKGLSVFILPVVFIMIYPMMVNLSLSSLKKIRGSIKPLIEALGLNFVYAPVAMYVLSSLFIQDPKIRLALMLLSIAPASSMGLGYIGLAEGHVLTGAVIVAIAFILSIFVYPVASNMLVVGTGIIIPTDLLLKSLFLVLILPLLLGVATREYIERKHEEGAFKNKFKPYFSVISLGFLYMLLFLIFASKAGLIVKNYMSIVAIAPVALLFYSITILLILFVNRKILNLEYGHHQAVVFTTVSKNVSLTIAILIAVFGEAGQYMAIVPAIVSLFQAPILMFYLKYSDRVKRFFSVNEK